MAARSTPAEGLPGIRVVTPPGSLAAALAPGDDRDVVLLAANCTVAEGWLERLREAAYCESTIATASPLAAEDLGVTREGLEAAAAGVARSSLRIRPRVGSPNAGCVYVRRSAIELLDQVTEDFFERCTRRGLSHVVADDVVAFGVGRAGPEPGAALARALSIARRATQGLSVLIDARVLGPHVTGTQIHVLELIAALGRADGVHVRALVGPNVGDYARPALASRGVEVVEVGEPGSETVRADVVHRPFQVSSDEDLRLLGALGERVVITHQDLIGYRNPAYFASGPEWLDFRQLTRRALAAADHVVFFSSHARADAMAEDLIEPGRASVVHVGVDHAFGSDTVAPLRPRGAPAGVEERELILCLGTDLEHKNRVFALRVLDQLRRRHGWDGYLAFAGLHLERGSSRAEEAEMLARSPELSARVLELGHVEEAEKAWLLERARLVLYPTVYEGFGLVPFEAAEHSVPCLWATGTALAETLPEVDGGIVAWDPERTAARANELLGDPGAAERHVAAIRAAGERLSWESAARELVGVYQATCDRPRSPGWVVEEMAPEAGVSEDGLRLVGRAGVIPRDMERPLLALATRPRLAGPAFALMRSLHRWMRRQPRR